MYLKKLLEHNSKLYKISYSDIIKFEFRLLKIREFNLLNMLLKEGTHPYFIYEEAFQLCYLNEYKYLANDIPVGYIISTGSVIFHLSGGNDGKEFLYAIAEERKRKPQDSLLEHIKSTIYLAFSSILPKDIEYMTEQELIMNFVQAENLLSKSKEGFQKLDLKKIYDELYNTKIENTPPKNIHISENSFLERNLDPHDLQTAENQMANEYKQKLSDDILRELDNRRK